MNQIQTAYHLLPWELRRAEEYAYKSVKHYIDIGRIKKRDEDLKYQMAKVGAVGEITFYELIDEKLKKLIQQWSMENHDFGCPYDFLISDMTVDIKTTTVSTSVPTPEKCNFMWSKTGDNAKTNGNIKLCDLYVQMLYDPDQDLVHFVGALTSNLIQLHKDGIKKWKILANSYSVISKKEFDATHLILKGFKKVIQKDTEKPGLQKTKTVIELLS